LFQTIYVKYVYKSDMKQQQKNIFTGLQSRLCNVCFRHALYCKSQGLL